MTHDLERYRYHSHQGWPVYDAQTPPSITGETIKRDDLFAGYEQGQADMLAKCIAAVEAIDDSGDADTRYILASAAATLRALQEKP